MGGGRLSFYLFFALPPKANLKRRPCSAVAASNFGAGALIFVMSLTAASQYKYKE